jgi:hypothetical protein
MDAHPMLATRPVVEPPPRRRVTVGASAAGGRPRHPRGMRRLWRHHGLSLTLFGLFLLCALGQSVVGHRHYNAEQQAHGHPALGYLAYLRTGHFVEALAENWESEFLQMAAYILLTVGLRQRGAPESKKLDAEEAVDADPADPPTPRRLGRYAGAGSCSRCTPTPSPSPSAPSSSSPSPCTPWAASATTTRNGWPPGNRRSRCSSTLGAPLCGSNRCKTGRASSWRWG